jgi:REP element-mobilizing transposase RayT
MRQIREGGRRSIRLPDHDYSLPGEYFVTICTRDRAPMLADARVREIVETTWHELPKRFPGVVLDEFVIMPNHIHGIIVFAEDLGAMAGALTLGRVVQWFKARVTRCAREAGCADFAWLRTTTSTSSGRRRPSRPSGITFVRTRSDGSRTRRTPMAVRTSARRPSGIGSDMAPNRLVRVPDTAPGICREEGLGRHSWRPYGGTATVWGAV